MWQNRMVMHRRDAFDPSTLRYASHSVERQKPDCCLNILCFPQAEFYCPFDIINPIGAKSLSDQRKVDQGP